MGKSFMYCMETAWHYGENGKPSDILDALGFEITKWHGIPLGQQIRFVATKWPDKYPEYITEAEYI